MPQTQRFIDSALSNLLSAWDSIQRRSRSNAPLKLSEYLHDNEREPLRQRIEDCINSKGGEVSARARAASLGEAYLKLNEEGKAKFFETLANDFRVDTHYVLELAQQLAQSEDKEQRLIIESDLREALRLPQMRLFTQFNALPQGTRFVVDFRADLMRFKRKKLKLQQLDKALKHLLSSWFDVGFLELRRITWNAPASLLEKLIHYEAVHSIESWKQLQHRLSSDRRCFAFFHPRMPDEPLIFVWVALVSEISDNVQALLDTSAPNHQLDEVNTAIFYSISNTQIGLQGVSLGNFLIKRVVDLLLKEIPTLNQFSTLSPIPGFRKHFEQQMAEGKVDFLTASEHKDLQKLLGDDKTLEQILQNDEWIDHPELNEFFAAPMLRQCADYLVNQRPRGRAKDPVANFHLSNGATIERINWMADSAEKGIEQSFGIMVNYLYELPKIDQHHEQYVETGEPPISKAMRQLLD